MSAETDARVLIGGRRQGFQGDWPGLVQETVFAIEAGKPVYLAGGFGGVTADMTMSLGLAAADWFPRTDRADDDPRIAKGLQALTEAVALHGLPNNGLTAEESAILATTYRPSEVASLVALGLGRLRPVAPHRPDRQSAPQSAFRKVGTGFRNKTSGKGEQARLLTIQIIINSVTDKPLGDLDINLSHSR